MAPACLSNNWKARTRAYIAGLRVIPKRSFSWRSPRCYVAILAELLVMSGDRCSYCDGFIGIESRQTIDHFRPKGPFPALAYSWRNLFPACDQCQSAKLEKYHPKLLRPDRANYHFDRYFICDFATGQVSPNPGASIHDQARAEKTIEICGLNSTARNKARLRERRKWLAAAGAMAVDEFNYRHFLV